MRWLALAGVLIALPTGAEPRYSVAAIGGYASEGRTFAIGGTSAYRLGFGVRAGVSLPKLYLGAMVTHHLGMHDIATSPGLSYDARYSTTLFGPEIGYDAPASRHLRLRPYLGGGPLYERSRTTVNGSVSDASHFRGFVTVGVVATYALGDAFVGVELRGVLSPFHDVTRWTPGAFATVGYAF